jgi:hypothetical protein
MQKLEGGSPMWSWWDSIEKVSKFYTYMQISIAVFGFFTASATYFSIKAANRISEIQSEKESETHKRLEATEAANKDLRAKMDHTEKIIAPPTISLIKKIIEKASHGLVAKLTFQSSKADGLPPLSFKAKIIEGNSKITLFDLDINDESIQQTNIGNGFPEISPDGKHATTKFHTINSPTASIRIDVDSPAKVGISGKYLKSPVVITIP